MKKIVLAVAVAAASATPAVAQDFAGPRVEARIGWDRVNVDARYDDGVDSFDEDGHEDGLTFGGELGYDAPVGPSVIAGVYGGLELPNTKFCGEVYGEDEGCLKAARNFTAGARFGGVVGSNLLAYAKGGYSNGKLKATYEDFEGILDDFSISDTVDGYHVGGGVELGFGPNMYGRVEYVYTAYSGSSYEDEDFDIGADLSRHQAVAGIGFRF